MVPGFSQEGLGACFLDLLQYTGVAESQDLSPLGEKMFKLKITLASGFHNGHDASPFAKERTVPLWHLSFAFFSSPGRANP